MISLTSKMAVIDSINDDSVNLFIFSEKFCKCFDVMLKYFFRRVVNLLKKVQKLHLTLHWMLCFMLSKVF